VHMVTGPESYETCTLSQLLPYSFSLEK